MTPFDPSAKAKKDYMQSGMKPADYNNQRLEWLQDMAASEGKEYKPGYVPQGYMKIQASPLSSLREKGKPANYTETWRYSSVNGKKPDALFWKPNAFAQYRPDLPAAKWDYTKDIQNYWHNPSNVIRWHETFRISDDDYEAPSYVDKDFVEEQYKALKSFNDSENDPLYWKPLPIGHEAAYKTNFGIDPKGYIPIYQDILEQASSPEAVDKRLEEYGYKRIPAKSDTENTIANYDTAVTAATIAQDEQDRKDAAAIDAMSTELNTSKAAEEVLAKLEGKVSTEKYNQVKQYFQNEGKVPNEQGEVQQEATPSWKDLYPWQRFTQSFTTAGAYPDKSEIATAVGESVPYAMAGASIYGITAGAASLIATTQAASTALATAAAATGVGIPAAVAIKIVAGLLSAGVVAYMYSQRDNPENTAVQKFLSIFSKPSEGTERAAGATIIGTELAKQGKSVDLRAAYDAGAVNYELHPNTITGGNFIYDSLSVAAEGLDVIGKAFGQDWNLSSGKTSRDVDNGVWLLKEGNPEPVTGEVPLGKEGLLMTYEDMLNLGDNRTRDQMEQMWAYYIDKTGSGGTLSDFMTQNLFDPMNFLPYIENAGLAKYADGMSKYYANLPVPDVHRATAFATLAEIATNAKGNLAIDALPMGVQQIAEKLVQGFESYADFKKVTSQLGDISWKQFSKNYIPGIHGTTQLPDTIHMYNSMMATGYKMPNVREFIIRPGTNNSDTVRLIPYTDGSMKMLNVDGKKNWEYSKADLEAMGVKYSVSESGTLQIEGVKKLLAKSGLPSTYAADKLDTQIGWRATDPGVVADIIDPTDAEYLDGTDPDVFTVKKGDTTYTVKKASGEVVKTTDANGTDTPTVKPTAWGEQPVIIKGKIYSPDEARTLFDLLSLTAKATTRPVNNENKSNAQINQEGWRGKITGTGNKSAQKAVDYLTRLSELTPGAKATIMAENFKETILMLHMFSGNNFELTMNAIKKLVGSTDVMRVAKVAEEFINQGGEVATVVAGFKVAFADNGMADTFVQMYRDTAPKRAIIDKISKQIDTTPRKLLEMQPENILAKLKTALASKTDAESMNMRAEIDAGRLNADSMKDLIAPFIGKEALPLTNDDYLAAVTMYTEKATQDFLINKFGIKKLDTWSRISSLKKAFLSPFLIGYIYTAWMTNFFSNVGSQVFLEGVLPLHSHTAILNTAKSFGVDTLPWEGSGAGGIDSNIIDAVGKMAMTLNPNDTIGKITRQMRKIGNAINVYSKIEKFNTSSLFVSEVMNMHRRINLPDMPENIKAEFTAAGVSTEQQRYIQHLLNRSKSIEEFKRLVTTGKEYDAITSGVIEQAADDFANGDPDRAATYRELATKVGSDEELLEKAKTIKTPQDLLDFRQSLDDALIKQVHVMLDASLTARRVEVENIMTKEGMAGGIKLMSEAIYGEMSTRLTNSLRWGDTMNKVDIAMRTGDYNLAQQILRTQRASSSGMFTRFYAMQDIQFKAMLDSLSNGDADSQAFAAIITKRHQISTDTMKNIEKAYADYFDAQTNGVKAKWEDTKKVTTKLMADMDKAELQSLKDMSALWVKMLGTKVTSNLAGSGMSATDLTKGGAKMMKKLIDGYMQLAKLRTEHYAAADSLTGQARRAASATFWNDVWQPKMAELMAMFQDDNYKTFFQTKTPLERQLYPTAPEPEVPVAPETTPDAIAQAEANVNHRIAFRDLTSQTDANVNAVHVLASAAHTSTAWSKFLDSIENLTPTQHAWADVFVHTLDDIYSAKSGKPSGSWLAEIGIEAAKGSDESATNIPLGAVINGELLDAAGVSRWNEVATKLKTLTSKNKTEAALLRDIDRIISEFPALADADKNLVTRSLLANIKNSQLEDFQLSDSAREVYNRLNTTNDAVELKARNADRMKAAPTGKTLKVSDNDATAKLVDINTLIGAYTYDPDTRTINNNQLFDKPADKAPTKKQLRANAKALDPDALLADVKGTELNAIFVDENGQIVSDGGNLLTLLYVKNNYPDIWTKYREALKANAATWGLSPKDIDALENGVLVLQVKGDADATARISGEDIAPEPIEAKVSKLSDRLDDFEDALQPSVFETAVETTPPELNLANLTKADDTISTIAKEVLDLRKTGTSPELDGLLIRLDQISRRIDEGLAKAKRLAGRADELAADMESGEPTQTPTQAVDEIQPLLPFTEYPVGSQFVHQNTGAGLDELAQLNIPLMRDQMFDIISQRMQGSERNKYKFTLPDGAASTLDKYLNIAQENQRLRMAAIFDSAKRVTKDIMIDYSRRRGIDQLVEMVLPYQFWYTRSMLMWLKRMVSSPNIMAVAYRYRELQRRNEVHGVPSRLAGKSPVYAPWLPKSLGDTMWINPGYKLITPEQLFQPFNNYADLDVESTQAAQRYIMDLARQKIITPEAAMEAIQTKSGNIWTDAIGYVNVNELAGETNAYTLANMAISFDPAINIMVNWLGGNKNKISPMPHTRIGNALEGVGGDGLFGVIGKILSAPEDYIRKKADMPEAGEFGDYYVGYWLANMAAEGSNYSVEELKNAMISHSGAAYEEAYAKAQQYIAYRTPGTAFIQAIRDGHRDPQTLASAFLMSFLPAGLFPEGEMKLRGLADEYEQAWKDFERGDKKSLENFDDAHPEYAMRRMMFQEPEEQLRGHLINIIWDKYTKLEDPNKAIAADTLGDAFKAYFLDTKTRNYNAVDEGTLTTWAKQLGGMVPSTPETEMQAKETVAPLKIYSQQDAAIIQGFIDERKAKFPNYFIYQGIYMELPANKQKKFLAETPVLKEYWDWKDSVAENNPLLKSYFDSLKNTTENYDTEYDAQAVTDMLSSFDTELLKRVISHQYTGEPLSGATKAALNALFQMAGKPGGDFNLWLKVLLNE